MEQGLFFFNDTTSTNNDSIIELMKQQEIIQDRPIFIGLGITLFILIEVIGNGSLLTMIIYEKCGMDNKKRTANNQLLSSLCKASIFCNVSIYPFLWVRVSFGVSLGMLHIYSCAFFKLYISSTVFIILFSPIYLPTFSFP